MANHVEAEKREDGLLEPFIGHNKEEKGQKHEGNKGALGMVLLSTAISCCGSFQFGACLGYSAPSQFSIMEELGLSQAEFSIFGSILNIGAMIGAITSGRIADLVGRKGAMRISSVICIAGWLAICIASGSLWLDFGRMLTGYAIGVFSYVVPVFISEISPKELRGALATTNQIVLSMGLSASYIIGAFVPWRTHALAGVVASLIMLAGLFFIPESPRWLAMVGRQDEVEASLKILRGPKTDISREEADVQESIALLRHYPKVTILDLFLSRNIRLVMVGVGIMVCQQFVGVNGIYMYAGQIFVSAGISPNVGTIAYAVLQVIVTAFGAVLIDIAGRKPLLVVSVSGMLIGNLLLGTSFLFKAFQSYTNLVPILAMVGIMIYMACYAIGLSPIPWVLMSELFPLHLKGTAGSLVTLVNWSGSWIISLTFSFLLGWCSYGIFYLYGAVCVLAIIFIIKMVPETKGRTLEEIQASVN